MATLGTRRVMDLEIELPPAGGWEGRLHLDSGAPPAAGDAVLTVGDLPLKCRVLANRGGLDAPEYPAVVVAGGYGWRAPQPAALFRSSGAGGVRLSTVLLALAAAAGETVTLPPELKLGPSYGWDAGTTGRAVLADLVSRGAIPLWRADTLTGSTMFTPWPTRPAADALGVVGDRALAFGRRYVLASSNVAAWLPGATVQGARIERLIIRERDSETTMEVRES